MATTTMYKPISWIFCRADGMTMWTQCEKFRIRAHSVPHDPKTENQTKTRGAFLTAKRLWSTLTDADKQAWSRFARNDMVQYNSREQLKRWRGIDAFVRASIARQNAELEPVPSVPRGGLPPTPAALDLLPGSDARELVFRIEHDVTGGLEDYAMLVRMTPTGEYPHLSPYKSSLRHVRGVGKDSVIPLQASGEVVRIPDTRFELVPGCVYAVEVRIMRLSDGSVSETFYQAAAREQEGATPKPPPTMEDIVMSMAATASPEVLEAIEPSVSAVKTKETAEAAAAANTPPVIAETAATNPRGEAGRTPALPAARAEHHGVEGLTEIARQRGSIYFPSEYVLRKYFKPDRKKQRKNVSR